MDNFVVRLKKLTEPNGGHLEHMPWSTQKQADRHRVLAIYFEYNKLVVSEFSFYLNGKLRNDARRKLGLVFWVNLC